MHVTSEMLLVAYFLSRCGSRSLGKLTPEPPAVLEVRTWRRAYAMFYSALGGGRTLTAFANSLRNTRDDFDGHVQSGRVGWRMKGPVHSDVRPPRTLSVQKTAILTRWISRSDDELWQAVRAFMNDDVRVVPESVLLDLQAELDPEIPLVKARTEGGIKVVLSIRVERDPSLRAAALRIHGTRCTVCGFSFGETYGPWGEDFGVVHHLAPFGLSMQEARVRQTDPRSDLAVVCANCHCMIHRRQNKVLTIEELRSKLTPRA